VLWRERLGAAAGLRGIMPLTYLRASEAGAGAANGFERPIRWESSRV